MRDNDYDLDYYEDLAQAFEELQDDHKKLTDWREFMKKKIKRPKIMSDDYDWEQAEYEWEREYKEKEDFKMEILKEVREELQESSRFCIDVSNEQIGVILKQLKELQNKVKELENIVEFNTSVGNISLLPWNWKD